MGNRKDSHKAHKRTRKEVNEASNDSRPPNAKRRKLAPASVRPLTTTGQTSGIDKRNAKIGPTTAVELRSNHVEHWAHSFPIPCPPEPLNAPSAAKKVRHAFDVRKPSRRERTKAANRRAAATTTDNHNSNDRLIVRPIAPELIAPSMKENMPSHHEAQLFLGPCGLRVLPVEDYLRIEPPTHVLLLVALHHPTAASFLHIYKQQLPENRHLYALNDNFVYLQLPVEVEGNTLLDAILHRTLTRDDMRRHLTDNAGGALYIRFLYAPGVSPVQLLFRELYQYPGTIQIWATAPQKRNYAETLKKIRSSEHRNELGARLFQELQGDQPQSLELCLALMEAERYNQRCETSETLNQSRPLLAVEVVLSQIDGRYKMDMDDIGGQFTSYVEPVVSLRATFQLIELAEANLPGRFAPLHSVLGLDKLDWSKKENQYRVQQLRHLAFVNFLSQERQHNCHLLTHFGAVMTAAGFAVSAPGLSYKLPTYSGQCLHPKVFVRKMKEWTDRKLVDEKTREALLSRRKNLGGYDNYQDKQQHKNQRGGHSSTYRHGTQQAFIEPQDELPGSPTADPNGEDKVEITYKNQKVPSVPLMPRFEDLGSFLDALKVVQSGSPGGCDVDGTGKRVAAYRQSVDTSEELVVLHRYASTKTRYAGQPAQFDSDLREKVVTELGKLRNKDGLFASARRFMSDSVLIWRGETKRLRILALPLSKEKEITKRGNGKVVLDMMHHAGLIERRDNGWVLADDFGDRFLFLFGDGLTLMRLEAFQQDLLPGPGRTFLQDYGDMRVFAQAMQHTVKLLGDLHCSFHMLGPVYLLYFVLLQPVQQLLGWKRIRGSDVTVCFQVAMQLHLLTLQECERLIVDELINSLSPFEVRYCRDPTALALLLAERLPKLIESMITGTDQVRCLIGNYVRLGRLVRLFRKAIRCGDALTMETLYLEFLPIWNLLGKSNYFDLCLSLIEEHYKRIDSDLLTFLRRNRTQRLHDIPCSDGTPAAERALDDHIEDIMHRLKSMPRKTDDDNWTDYFDWMPLCEKARVEVDTKFRHCQDVELADGFAEASLLEGADLGAPLQNRKRSVSPPLKTEREIILEFLVALKVHEEVPGRKMTTRLAWEAAAAVTTTFPKKSKKATTDEGIPEETTEPAAMESAGDEPLTAMDSAHLAATVDRMYDTPTEPNEGGDDSDLFDMSSLFREEGEEDSAAGEAGADTSHGDEMPINPTIRGKKVHVRIAPMNEKAVTDVFQTALSKMDEMNISKVYLRKKQRRSQRRRRLYDDLFDSLEEQEELYIPKAIVRPSWRRRLLDLEERSA